MAHGSIHWSECVTKDPEAAKAHYSAVCGWTFVGVPMPGRDGDTYWIAKSGEETVGGLMSVSSLPQEVPPHWMTYIAVDDVEAAVAKVESTGGSVVSPPFDVPEVGRIAMIADPGGALAGFIQPASS